jgi:indolepyruvate ferredoxin oxidoreductase
VNLFLLGIAFQHRKVPVSAEALEAAIALNGVAVEGNQQAFLLGRRYAVWPEKVLSMLPMSRTEDDEGSAVDFDLGALIEDRASRLVDYQSSAFANRYRADVAAIRTADAIAEQEGSATHRVAEQLYRLMAIKDEYEVARLYTNGAFKAQLDAQFEPGYQLQFHLAPPVISKPKTPHDRIAKQTFGAWIMPVLKVLSALRKLRNTPLDPFTWTRDRRDALSDLGLYRSDLALLMQHLDETHYATALMLAELPKQLRGFGPVRDQNRHIVRARRTTLRQQLSDKLLPFTEINTEQYLAKEA